MLLPQHPGLVDRLRHPTAGEPWRALVSGCLASWPCGVDGSDYGLGNVLDGLLELPTLEAIPFCPEQHALGTPRSMPDIHGGDAAAPVGPAGREPARLRHPGPPARAARAGLPATARAPRPPRAPVGTWAPAGASPAQLSLRPLQRGAKKRSSPTIPERSPPHSGTAS